MTNSLTGLGQNDGQSYKQTVFKVCQLCWARFLAFAGLLARSHTVEEEEDISLRHGIAPARVSHRMGVEWAITYVNTLGEHPTHFGVLVFEGTTFRVVSRGTFPILSRDPSFRKPSKTRGNRRLLKKTMVEKNRKSTPRGFKGKPKETHQTPFANPRATPLLRHWPAPRCRARGLGRKTSTLQVEKPWTKGAMKRRADRSLLAVAVETLWANMKTPAIECVRNLCQRNSSQPLGLLFGLTPGLAQEVYAISLAMHFRCFLRGTGVTTSKPEQMRNAKCSAGPKTPRP